MGWALAPPRRVLKQPLVIPNRKLQSGRVDWTLRYVISRQYLIFYWVSVAFPYNWYRPSLVPVIGESNGNPMENQVLPRYRLSQGPTHSSRLQFSICVCQRLLKNPTRWRKGSAHLMSPILYRLGMLAGATPRMVQFEIVNDIFQLKNYQKSREYNVII